jgi:hypothetical protein
VTRWILMPALAIGLAGGGGGGCASSRVPEALRGYDILVEPKDLQSLELAWAMRQYGFRVRQKVRGGSHPTAALIYFIYSDPGAGEASWFHVRLADTRSGAILRTGAVPLDSLTPSTRTRAIAAVEALIAP